MASVFSTNGLGMVPANQADVSPARRVVNIEVLEDTEQMGKLYLEWTLDDAPDSFSSFPVVWDKLRKARRED